MKTPLFQSVTVELPYTPPLDWPFFLRYLASRAALGVEFIHDNTYWRPIEIEGRTGTIAVTHNDYNYNFATNKKQQQHQISKDDRFIDSTTTAATTTERRRMRSVCVSFRR